MKHNKWLTVVLFLLLLPVARAQDAKFKALFMYNFTKYLEWPSEKQKGDFVIGVYGNSPIVEELMVISQKKQVGSQKIVVKRVTSPAEFSSCNILYVPESRSAKIEEIASNCKGKGTALITDKPGLAQAISGINYVMVNGRQNFEINKGHLESQGIKVNSALLSLGIAID